MTRSYYRTGYSAAVPSEVAWSMFPDNWVPGTTGVMYAHGAGQLARHVRSTSWPGQLQVVQAILRAGFPVLACDLAGDNYGNTTGISRMDEAWDHFKDLGVNPDRVLLAGGSMGNVLNLNWTRVNRGVVGAVVGFIPAADVQDAVVNNRAGQAAAVNAAYGGAHSEATHGPAHNPVTYAAADLAGLPFKAYAASNDASTPYARTEALVAAIGSTASLVNVGALGHTEAAISAIDTEDLVRFLSRNA